MITRQSKKIYVIYTGGTIGMVAPANVQPQDWVNLSQQIMHHYDGFIILHGTDTLAYTASALSFMLGNLRGEITIIPGEKT